MPVDWLALLQVEQQRSEVEVCTWMGDQLLDFVVVVVVVVLLFYVHGKHLRSCRDGQLT